jgi:uncharacterized protein involved in type VI secretion and phage assembly
MTHSHRYYGKYRGTVINNLDPEQIGRIQALVPDVFGTAPSPWAMPCVPFTGPQSGVFVLPSIGANVWIEFEQGDLDKPVWTGGFWGSAAEVPALAVAGDPAFPSIVLQTRLQNAVVISDQPGPAGGILLKAADGASIAVNEEGITISNGKGASITMTGPETSLNGDALTVI